MSRFADMLSFLRRREGLSQQELAEKLGVAKSTISMYERGSRKPSFEMLEAIADFFNTSMDTLVGSDNALSDQNTDAEMTAILEELRNREDMRMLFRLAKGASPEDVRQAVKIIEALRKEE